MNPFRALGRQTIAFVRELGAITIFLGDILRQSGMCVARPSMVIRQIYFSGVLSILIVSISGLFMGMVLGLQGHNTLAQFKSTESLGFVAALGLLREIGPVLSALLFASSAGGAMTSEIGLMKVTGQLEAMEIMAVNPVARIVAPRFWAGFISMPFLATICNAMGIYGTYLIGVDYFGLDAGAFWSQMQAGIDLRRDVVNGLIKSSIFGAAVSLIAARNGFNALPTSEGIMRGATRTVVISALAILALDFVMTALMFS